MARGVAHRSAVPRLAPVADGGDGTLDVLLLAAGSSARLTRHGVTGPLGGRVAARLGWLGSDVAVVELAEASGLRLLRGRSLDALPATSRGTGELLRAALDAGARRVIVGVGGSASTDGGAGLLQALGARFLDGDGRDVPPGGAGLVELASVDLKGLDTRLTGCTVDVATDVRNPLLGPDGAAAVFAPQKGASAADVAVLERGLARLVEVVARNPGAALLADLDGAGAAGGCGFGLALAGAHLIPGAPLVCDLVGLDAAIAGAGLVLTGEGQIDSQTAAGKAPYEVAHRARLLHVPCVAIGGRVLDALGDTFSGVLSLEQLARGDARSAGDPKRHARRLLRRAAEVAVQRYLGSGQ